MTMLITLKKAENSTVFRIGVLLGLSIILFSCFVIVIHLLYELHYQQLSQEEQNENNEIALNRVNLSMQEFAQQQLRFYNFLLNYKNLKNITELEHLLTPASCRTSSVYGRQILRSEEEVFCDGGWTVFQRRFNGSVSFDRVWNEYKNGFGNLSGEFWLGLEKIHLLTKGRGCRLRVDLWSFDGDHAYAEYKDFSIEDESDNYRLHIAGYSGTAGNSMIEGQSNDKRQFTTKDRDNDEADNGNCGVGNGGWWYWKCGHALLNKRWGQSQGAWSNIVWYDWKGKNEALKSTLMKIKCE